MTSKPCKKPNLGMQFIIDRRAREEAARFYNAAAAADNTMRQRAQFETRGLCRFQANELKRRAAVRVAQSDYGIDERRRKLANLFQQEDVQFSKEINEAVESPAQRRLRLKEQLVDLKARRQQEHDDFVKERNDQAWRDQCDPLRPRISEALTRQVVQERDQQLVEKEQRKFQEDQDEVQYVEHIKKTTQQWHDDLKRAEEIRRQKLRQNKETWLGQIAEHQQIANEQKEREYQESLEYRTTIEGAIRAAKEAADKKAAEQLARRAELDALNTEQLNRKRKLIEEEKAFDTAYAKKAAEELRQQEEDELVERIVRNRKADVSRKLLEKQMNKKAAGDEITEMYIKKTQQEYNDREDAMRMRDAERRRKMMLDAVADRVNTIKLHQQQKEQRKLDKLEEKRKLEEDLEEERLISAEQAEQRRMRIENQYKMLQSQTKMKHEREAKERKEQQDAIDEMVRGWDEEERRIQEEIKNPHYFTGGRFRGYR